MSAIPTKKKNADRATQLTYPAVFASVYAESGMPLQYLPEQVHVSDMPMAGDDLLANVHLVRKEDADRMAAAKVMDTHNARVRAFTGHAGYHLPPPTLSQRVYANPSNGALSIYSARQDLHGHGYSGGVLRTAEGQAYGKARLVDRINQLNQITSAKQLFTMGVPMTSAPAPRTLPSSVAPQAPSRLTTALPEEGLSETARYELYNLLQQVNDNLSFFPPAGFDSDSIPSDVGKLLKHSTPSLKILMMRMLSVYVPFNLSFGSHLLRPIHQKAVKNSIKYTHLLPMNPMVFFLKLQAFQTQIIIWKKPNHRSMLDSNLSRCSGTV